MKQSIKPKGVFTVQLIRDGKVIKEDKIHNDATDVGLNTLLNIMFGSTAKISTWYCGLIDNSGYTGVSDSDTMSSHSGWSEFTNYTVSGSAVRATWNTGTSTSKVISNSTAMSFTMTGSGTIKGLFCCDEGTQGGNTGTLWATAIFSSTYSVVSGDVLNVTYAVSASG